jgi:hypothetical protein
MNEEQWLAHASIADVLKWKRARPNERKLRLLICAWCRRRWDELDQGYQHGVEVAELFADGQASDAELGQARVLARSSKSPMYGVPCAFARGIQYTDASNAAATLARRPSGLNAAEATQVRLAEKKELLAILDDIIQPPNRLASFSREWRTDTAVALARTMYDSRDFSGMPILADALQDAGCDNTDVLNHCRDPQQVHVRGCWVVDLVLGKS